MVIINCLDIQNFHVFFSMLCCTQVLQFLCRNVGLEYLHDGCKLPIIHRDVKSSNILLNDKFQAKLGDFGLFKFFPSEAGNHITTSVAGTPGYLDPE